MEGVLRLLLICLVGLLSFGHASGATVFLYFRVKFLLGCLFDVSSCCFVGLSVYVWRHLHDVSWSVRCHDIIVIAVVLHLFQFPLQVGVNAIELTKYHISDVGCFRWLLSCWPSSCYDILSRRIHGLLIEAWFVVIELWLLLVIIHGLPIMARNVRLSISNRIYISMAVSLVSALLLPLALLLSFDISLNCPEQGFLFLQLPLQQQLLLVILIDFCVFCDLKLLKRLLMRSLSEL